MIFAVLKATILGIVEGLTEFIPVSSTGHLILVGKWINFTGPQAATFDIAIQLGAILAVVVYYRTFFMRYLSPKEWVSPISQKIVVAMIPAVVIGFLFHKAIKAHLFNPFTVSLALLVGGIAMAIVSFWKKNVESDITLDTMSFRQAFGVGVAQCFSLWPGMSRSASTIIGGIVGGLSYEVAAEFSFIVAVPIMILAVSFDLLSSLSALTINDLILIVVGFIVAFLVAWASIGLFFKILRRYRLFPFAVYRIIIALVILAVFYH